MKDARKPLRVMIADDDPDDQWLITDALKAANIAHQVVFVSDGVELMDYLHQKGQYSNPQAYPRPDLILLDLNMPRKDGREALCEIKSDPELRRIPVVIFTTSQSAEDVAQCYDLGGNAYVVKPHSFAGLVQVLKTLDEHWCNTARLAS